MRKRSDILATIGRLLNVKRAQGLAAAPPPPSADDHPLENPVACVNCGYDQQGQSLDRCPECGLAFASRLHDSTPWIALSFRPLGWWETARRVWLWDRRTRLRTSYLPVTPESWSFAKWSITASALLLGMALAAINWSTQTPHSLAMVLFLLQTALAAVLAGLFLLGTLHGLTLLIRGTWRRRLRFIPSSIHYATAWWPPLALLAFLAGASSHVLGQSENDLLLALVPMVALATWGLWLWGSVTESEHVPNVAPRIGAIAFCMYLTAAALLLFVPGPSRTLVAGFLNRTGSSLVKLNARKTYAASPPAPGPRTRALLIDAIPDGGEGVVSDQIGKLGATDWVRLRNKECTLDQIKKVLSAACTELRSQDKFILYINGHGSPYGSGSIAMADGEITSQQLTEFLQKLPTTHCLVVLDSCFAGKFISAFREGRCNAVVITASDNSNIAFTSGLSEFWRALDMPESDRNLDGRVAVDEAFWSAFRPMLAKGEMSRERDLQYLRQANAPADVQRILADHGFATPQLEVLGKASRDDFFVPLPVAEPGTQPSPPQ